MATVCALTSYYPIAVNLKRRLVILIGGGKVSERKVKGLLAAGANVTMVTPGITPQLKRLVKLKRLKWRKDKVSKKEILGARLVIAATNNPAVNRKVSSWARERKILANVVDRPALSDFISPAVLRKDKAIIAVYTDGKDPVLSRDLKNFLKENWSEFISYRRRL